MTPEQIQQMMQQTAASYDNYIFSSQPWWAKLIFITFIAAQLACAICLPLITWKLWQNNRTPRTTTKSAPVSPQILERQARREAIRKIAEEPQTAGESQMPEAYPEISASNPESEDDSRYLPKE